MAILDALSAVRRAGLADPLQVVARRRRRPMGTHARRALRRAAALRHPGRAAGRRRPRRAELTPASTLRSSALARGLLASGLRPATTSGLLCANHRDFVEANVAAAKAGLVAVYLNTGFAAPQLAEVLRGKEVRGVVCDIELLADRWRRRLRRARGDARRRRRTGLTADPRGARRRAWRHARPAALRPRLRCCSRRGRPARPRARAARTARRASTAPPGSSSASPTAAATSSWSRRRCSTPGASAS